MIDPLFTDLERAITEGMDLVNMSRFDREAFVMQMNEVLKEAPIYIELEGNMVLVQEEW